MALTLEQLTSGGITADQWKKWLDQAKTTSGAGYVQTDIQSGYGIPTGNMSGPSMFYLPYKLLAPGVSTTTGGTTSVLGASGQPNQISIYGPEASTYLSYEDVYKAVYGSVSGATNVATLYPNPYGSPEAVAQVYQDYYNPANDPYGYRYGGTTPATPTATAPSAPTNTYVKDPTSGAYFYNSASGLQAVNDPNILRQLMSGSLSYQTMSVAGMSTASQVQNTSLLPAGTTAPAPSPIPSVIDSSAIGATGAAAAFSLSLPSFSSTQNYASYFGSIAGTIDQTRKTLEQRYQQELQRLQTDKAAVEKQIADLTAKQEGVLGQAQEALSPFRAQLETSERERLKIEENYFANQALVEELGQLLTDIQAQVQAERDVTGLASIRNPRIEKAMKDAAARVGVIEATMAARNNQISVAQNLIDRSVQAIALDRQDRLNYYNTLLNFYEGQKDTKEAQLVTLTKTERDYINAQIGLIESDYARALQTADIIKNAMLDPQKATAYAQAGVTMNDTPEQIAQKLSRYAYTQEVKDLQNSMAANGFTYLLPQQVATKPANEVTTIRDSQGNTYYFWKQGQAQKLDTQVVTSGGRLILINAQTGQKIADLGAATTGTGTSQSLDNAAVVNQYGSRMLELVRGGMSVLDAVQDIALEAADTGLKLDAQMRDALVQYAKATVVETPQPVAPTTQPGFIPLAQISFATLKAQAQTGNLNYGQAQYALETKIITQDEFNRLKNIDLSFAPSAASLLDSVTNFLFGK